MVKRLIFAAVAVTFAISAAPALATPSNLLYVDVACPSGSQTIGFIDNNGSIVGFDENGNVVQFHKLDATLSVTVSIDDVDVVDLDEAFPQQIGKGKGLGSQLEACSFSVTFAEFMTEITAEFAAQFEADFGSDELSQHIGEDAHVLSVLAGDVWLKFPGRN